MADLQLYYLPANVREAILQYFYTRPYAEVAEGVRLLLSLPPVPLGNDRPDENDNSAETV